MTMRQFRVELFSSQAFTQSLNKTANEETALGNQASSSSSTAANFSPSNIARLAPPPVLT